MSTPPVNPKGQLTPSNITRTTNPTGMQSLTHVVQEAMQISTEPPRAILNPTVVNSLNLPNETLLQCFFYLDFKILAKICSRVCKQFRQVAEDSHLWRFLLERDLGVALRRCSNPKELYRNFFLNRCRVNVVKLPPKTNCVQHLSQTRECVLVGSQEGMISLFNLRSHHSEPILKLVTSIACLQIKGTEIFCGTESGTIGMLDCSKNDEKSCLAFTLFPPDSPFNPIRKMYLFDHLLAIGHTGATSIVNIRNKEFVALLIHLEDEGNAEESSISALTMNDGYICVGFENGTIEVWALGNFQKLRTFPAHAEEVSCLQIVGNCLYSSALNEDTIKVWDLGKGDLLRELSENNNGGISIFRVQGPYLFFDHVNQIKMRHLLTGRCSVLTNEAADEESIIRSFFIHGAHLMAATDEKIYLYSFASAGTTWEV